MQNKKPQGLLGEFWENNKPEALSKLKQTVH